MAAAVAAVRPVLPASPNERETPWVGAMSSNELKKLLKQIRENRVYRCIAIVEALKSQCVRAI